MFTNQWVRQEWQKSLRKGGRELVLMAFRESRRTAVYLWERPH
jgi:hypothetical protein